MIQCPKCKANPEYKARSAKRPRKLKDGRYSCPTCRTRFGWKSVWDSVRLTAETRDLLLKMVVAGMPSHSTHYLPIATAPSRERFGRLARACCAYAEQLRRPFRLLDASFDSSREGHPGRVAETVVAFRVAVDQDKVLVRPIASGKEENAWRDAINRAPSEVLQYVDEQQAYVTLPVRGGRVMLTGVPRQKPPTTQGLGYFWWYLTRRLERFPWFHREYFHLYVGEACFRYNRRHSNKRSRKDLLRNAMERASMTDIRLLISGGNLGSAPGDSSTPNELESS
jgi:transposase